jgi:hypothetical protein
MGPKLIEMDEIIQKIYLHMCAQESTRNTLFVLLSDHGMNSVRNKMFIILQASNTKMTL